MFFLTLISFRKKYHWICVRSRWHPIVRWKPWFTELPRSLAKDQYVGSLSDRKVACSATGYLVSNYKSCVWRAVSSDLFHHSQCHWPSLACMCTNVDHIFMYLRGHHSISKGGAGFFCRWQIIHFNPARRPAEDFKFYYMFMYNTGSELFISRRVRLKLFISKILQPPPPFPLEIEWWPPYVFSSRQITIFVSTESRVGAILTFSLLRVTIVVLNLYH